MTMEAYALCPRAISGVAEWQAAIDALGFDLSLRTEKIPPATIGHLPAMRRGRESGFECSVIPFSELRETYPTIKFGGPWRCVYAFYFATIPACIGALMATAACVKLSGGIAFDPQQGRLLTAEQAARCARDTTAQAEDLEVRLKEGTR